MAQRVYLLSTECWRPADHLPHLAQIAMEELIGLGLFAVRSTLHAKLGSGILLWDPVKGLRALPSTEYGHATNYIALNAGHRFIGRLGIWKAEWVLAKQMFACIRRLLLVWMQVGVNAYNAGAHLWKSVHACLYVFAQMYGYILVPVHA